MPLRTFEGGVAIVTGAASGIGRALAHELARRGAEVLVTDIDLPDAERVAGEIRDQGGRASAMPVDVTNAAQVKAVVDHTFVEHGRLDYLFNNAGIAAFGAVAEHTPGAWRRIVEVNVMGVVHGVQAAYPRMLAQGHGHIVNIASTAGLLPSPGLASYSLSKHAVVGLSRALRAEARARGVRASVICPGVIRTPILDGGRHGVLLMEMSEQDQRYHIASFFERFRPMPVHVFARKALDRVARNQGIIIVPVWWRALWWLDRIAPGLSGFLAQRAFEADRRAMAASGATRGRG